MKWSEIVHLNIWCVMKSKRLTQSQSKNVFSLFLQAKLKSKRSFTLFLSFVVNFYFIRFLCSVKLYEVADDDENRCNTFLIDNDTDACHKMIYFFPSFGRFIDETDRETVALAFYQRAFFYSYAHICKCFFCTHLKKTDRKHVSTRLKQTGCIAPIANQFYTLSLSFASTGRPVNLSSIQKHIRSITYLCVSLSASVWYV